MKKKKTKKSKLDSFTPVKSSDIRVFYKDPAIFLFSICFVSIIVAASFYFWDMQVKLNSKRTPFYNASCTIDWKNPDWGSYTKYYVEVLKFKETKNEYLLKDYLDSKAYIWPKRTKNYTRVCDAALMGYIK